MAMYIHTIGKGSNSTFEVDTYNYWMDFAMDFWDMGESESHKLYEKYKEYLNNWEENYIYKLGEECEVGVKTNIFGYQVYYKTKNNIRFGTMAEAGV